MSALVKSLIHGAASTTCRVTGVYVNTVAGTYPRAVTWYVPVGYKVKSGEVLASYETCSICVNGIYRYRTYNVTSPHEGVIISQNMEMYSEFSPIIPVAEISK